MVVLYSILNVAGINSQIIYTANNSGRAGDIIRRNYLKNLALELTEEHLHRRSLETNVPPDVRLRRQDVAGTSVQNQVQQSLPAGIRKRCFHCKSDNKTRYYCEVCKKFLFTTCKNSLRTMYF